MQYKVGRTSEVFYIKLEDGSKAYLTYKIEGNKMLLISTYTPPQHRGKGLARLLVESAINHAVENNYKIIPICSYATYYFIKNKDSRKVLDNKFRNMSDDELRKYYEERLKEEQSKSK